MMLTLLSARWPRSTGSKRVALRASVFVGVDLAVVGRTARLKIVVPTRGMLADTAGTGASASITKTS
jgi:hypothetical protein